MRNAGSADTSLLACFLFVLAMIAVYGLMESETHHQLFGKPDYIVRREKELDRVNDLFY